MTEALPRHPQFVVEFHTGIMIKDQLYDRLELCVPRVGWRLDAEQFVSNGTSPRALTQYSVRLMSRCAGVPEAVIHELEGPQFDQAWAWISAQLNPEPAPEPEPERQYITATPVQAS